MTQKNHIAGLVAAFVAATGLAACSSSGDGASLAASAAARQTAAAAAQAPAPAPAAAAAAAGANPAVQESSMGGHTYGPARSPAQMLVEYRDESTRLRLAPGWDWPPRISIATTGPDGDPMQYELGYGRMAADQHWLCSWKHRLVSTPRRSARRAEAYKRLLGVRRLFYYREALAPLDRRLLDKQLVKARHRNVRGFERDVVQNCPRDQASI